MISHDLCSPTLACCLAHQCPHLIAVRISHILSHTGCRHCRGRLPWYGSKLAGSSAGSVGTVPYEWSLAMQVRPYTAYMYQRFLGCGASRAVHLSPPAKRQSKGAPQPRGPGVWHKVLVEGRRVGCSKANHTTWTPILQPTHGHRGVTGHSGQACDKLTLRFWPIGGCTVPM